MEIVWIYFGFCGAIANFVVWISLFFPVSEKALRYIHHAKIQNIIQIRFKKQTNHTNRMIIID
jgi:hypothetical protein